PCPPPARGRRRDRRLRRRRAGLHADRRKSLTSSTASVATNTAPKRSLNGAVSFAVASPEGFSQAFLGLPSCLLHRSRHHLGRILQHRKLGLVAIHLRVGRTEHAIRIVAEQPGVKIVVDELPRNQRVVPLHRPHEFLTK